MMNDTVYKFDDQCQPIPYYGNTIISFLNEEQSEVFQAAVKVQEEIKKLNFSKQLAFLPPDSFHMTVLPLCREIDRGTPYWPPMVPKDARFSEVDRILKEMVDKVPMPEGVLMEIEECRINKIILRPCDESSAEKLLRYRDEVSETVGIRHVTHEGFRYHISLNYIVKPFNHQQEEERDRVCQNFTEWLKKSVKPFLLPKPDFVIFNDMMSYEKDLSLRGNQY